MDTTTAAAVRARELRKDFGEGPTRIEVLRGVDFDALLGQLTFLVGPSGCGKTTLISVIAGLLDSSGGEVRLFDQNIERFSATERILFRRKNLGFVFQQYNLLPALTASENAAVPLLAAGVRRKRAVERASALLADLGLERRLHALPLGGGWKVCQFGGREGAAVAVTPWSGGGHSESGVRMAGLLKAWLVG